MISKTGNRKECYYMYSWQKMISPCRQRLKKELMIRSSHRRCSVKKDVLINLTKFTRKDLCQSLACNKVTGLSLETLLKKRLCHGYSKNASRWQLLNDNTMNTLNKSWMTNSNFRTFSIPTLSKKLFFIFISEWNVSIHPAN